jgi:FMN phosphatase YigB (HAD superfamily)
MGRIKLIVTDLDNTIYNWVDYYAPCFQAMLHKLVEMTGIDEQALKASFKRVHQRHHTSEYAFAIEELDVLGDRDRELTLAQRLAKYYPAIQAFRDKRDETLKVYPGVVDTLKLLQAEGRLIVAYTDAMMFYAIYRLQRQLGIAHLFDGLFAPKDHGLPAGAVESDVRSYQDPSKYRCAIRMQRELGPGLLKPDSRVLELILAECAVAPGEAVCVGDSLHKDVYMAQACGVHDVHAAYGREYDQANYRLLIDITHWTDQDVDRETRLAAVQVIPNHVIYAFSALPEIIQEIERRDSLRGIGSSRAPETRGRLG